MQRAIESEIDRNYAAFKGMLAELILNKRDHYALLRDRVLEGVFPSAGEADRVGHARFDDGIYSIQRVTDQPVDLGFYSYGYDNRQD